MSLFVFAKLILPYQLMHEMGLYSISPASKLEYIKWQKGENRNII